MSPYNSIAMHTSKPIVISSITATHIINWCGDNNELNWIKVTASQGKFSLCLTDYILISVLCIMAYEVSFIQFYNFFFQKDFNSRSLKTCCSMFSFFIIIFPGLNFPLLHYHKATSKCHHASMCVLFLI